MSVLEILGLDEPTNYSVVTATITECTPDIAMVETRDGTRAVLPASEFYPNTPFQKGETYQLLLFERSPTPICSAVRPELVSAVFSGISPEIREGTVRIVSIARSAGQRSKVAVAATVAGLDPVAALIGREANRVKTVGSLLNGERLDIVAFHADADRYLMNALAPAAVSRVEIDGDVATAYAPPHQMSAAVGSAGLNSQLAGQLLGLPVRIAAE